METVNKFIQIALIFEQKAFNQKMHVILACIGLVVTDVHRQLLESFLSFWDICQWGISDRTNSGS